MPKSMSWSEPRAILRYGAAVAAIAAAVAVGSLLQPALAPVVSLLLCGVLFAAWFGGLGPGLLAIILGLLAFDYFFLPPLYSLAVQSHNDVLRLIAFAVAALFVVVLSARQESTTQSLRRAHSDLQATVRELERTNASLRAENAERQRAEAALRQSEKDLQTIIETIPAFVVRYRADGTPDFVNQTLRELVGPGVGHDGMRSAVHPDDLPQNLRDWRAHVAAGEPYENEMRLRRLDGAYRWLRIRRVPLRDANGTIVNWYGAGHDIDDQKRAEAALRESEKSLQTVIDTIPALVMRYRADGTADFMNHTMREFIGPGVVLDGKNSTVHPEDYPRRLRDWRAHVAAGEPYENEMRMRRADGVYRWHRVRRVPLRDANGVIVNWYGVGFDIDDQKCAETALRESEYRLRQIFETVPGLLWSTGPDGEPAYVNQRILHYIGKPFEDFKQGGWGAFIHPDDLPETEKDFSHAIQTGTSHEAVHRLRRADGEYRWHRTRAEPLRDQQGRTIQWYGLSVDIDEAKKAEDRLRRSEAHFAEAQRLSHTGSAVYNETEILYWSEESSRIWGFDPQQGIPSRDAVWQRIHPDDLDRVNANIEYAVREKRSFVNEFRIILLDGTVKHIEATNHPAFSASGELLEIFVTGIDVTERKRAAQALRESEARLAEARRELQQTIDTIPIIVARYSPGGEREFVNAAWKRFTGLSDEAAHSMGLFFSVHPDDVADVKRKSLEALAKGEPLHIETRLRRADGEYRWRAVDCVARRDEDGSISNWYGVSYDIEDRKRAEDALRRSEAYLAEAQRLSVIGSFGWRIPGNVVVWSMETYRIFAVDPATVPTLELVLARTHPEDVERVQQYVERMAQEDRDFDVEHRLLLPNGVVKHLHVRTHRVQFEGGEIEIIGAVMDVTAARKGEDALRHAQAELAHAARVATLGELSASIAHEVNQPLASIVASGEAAIRWLDRDVPEKERAQRAIMRLLNEAQRASQVIRRIRELAKKAEPEMAQVDINGLVEDAVTLVYREAASQRVAVRTQLASELPPVRGDRIQLQQVLINLAINGIQAMASVTDRARVLVIRTQRYGDDELLVAVEDAGVGIAPENLDRLFSAFYTTKPDGMGMGLSISRSIVEEHGGRVWATPNSGPGMTFQFTLSAHRERTAASSPLS